MLTKNQFEIMMSLFDNGTRAVDLDDYLKTSLDVLYDKLSPVSIAAYISIEAEDKIVLVGEKGRGFDEQIASIDNFSLMVRKAIKKKNVIYIPSGEGEGRDETSMTTILVPMVGGDRVIGMLVVVYDTKERTKHKADVNFYMLISRLMGYSGFMKECVDTASSAASGDPEAHYSDRINSLGVLSSGFSHEFNNILAVIRGYSDLISMSSDDKKLIRDAVSVIDSQTERGARLIDSLGVFTRGKEARLSYQPLNEIVAEAVRVQRALVGAGVKISENYCAGPRVLSDREMLIEAISNVIQNSCNTLKQDEPGMVEVITEYADDKFRVSVRDNGYGISREQADVITTPEAHPAGTADAGQDMAGKEVPGLRLAIAYGIMQSMGGSLNINSDSIDGKEVALVFSRLDVDESRGARYDGSGIVYFGDTRILVVDDENSIRQFLKKVFEGRGYQVISAASGEEAVEICSVEDIDIVFLDYLMPDMKGDRVFDSIKKACPSIDVVFITGVDGIPNINSLLDRGLAYVMKKPFKLEKILQVTNDLIYKRIGRKKD